MADANCRGGTGAHVLDKRNVMLPRVLEEVIVQIGNT
jgi:hypothetical protein